MVIVGISVFELHLPQARSLKDKRRSVKSLIDRLHAKHRISIAETDHHDLHQRSELALAVVGRSDGELQELLASLRRSIETDMNLVLTHWQPELIEGA